MKISIGAKIAIVASLLNCIIWYALAKSIGFYEVKVYVYRNFFTFGFLLVGIFLSIFLTKRNNKGFIEFKDAMRTGMFYCLILAITLAVFNYIYYTFITPDTIDYFIAEAKKVVPPEITAADLPKYMDSVRANYGSFRLIPPVLFWGLILSLIASAILQKKDPHVFSEN